MTKFLRSANVWVLGTTILAAASTVNAQQAQTPDQILAPPAARPQPDRYVVGQARPVPAAGSQLMDLTLEQATDLALEKNLDLKAQRLAPQAVDYQLQAARAAFNPRFTSSYNYNNSSQPNNSTLETGLTTITSKRQQFNGSVN